MASLAAALGGHDGNEFPTAFLVYYTIALKPTGHEIHDTHSLDTEHHSLPFSLFSVFAFSDLDAIHLVFLHCTAEIKSHTSTAGLTRN